MQDIIYISEKVVINGTFIFDMNTSNEYISKIKFNVFDGIQNILDAYILNSFFPWVCLILLLYIRNWKKPIIKILVGHWLLRSTGDLLRNIMQLRSIKPNQYWPYSSDNWFISNAVANIFWIAGEIMGDWYPLIRTKAVVHNIHKQDNVYLTCAFYNVVKLFGIYCYFIHTPMDLAINNKTKNKNKISDIIDYNILWWTTIAVVQIGSFIYNLSVIFALKKYLFRKLRKFKKKNQNNFLNKYKQISELRLFISILVTIIFLPFVFVLVVVLINELKKNNGYNNFIKLEGHVEQIRKAVLNINYTFMYIDQILLSFYSNYHYEFSRNSIVRISFSSSDDIYSHRSNRSSISNINKINYKLLDMNTDENNTDSTKSDSKSEISNDFNYRRESIKNYRKSFTNISGISRSELRRYSGTLSNISLNTLTSPDHIASSPTSPSPSYSNTINNLSISPRTLHYSFDSPKILSTIPEESLDNTNMSISMSTVSSDKGTTNLINKNVIDIDINDTNIYKSENNIFNYNNFAFNNNNNNKIYIYSNKNNNEASTSNININVESQSHNNNSNTNNNNNSNDCSSSKKIENDNNDDIGSNIDNNDTVNNSVSNTGNNDKIDNNNNNDNNDSIISNNNNNDNTDNNNITTNNNISNNNSNCTINRNSSIISNNIDGGVINYDNNMEKSSNHKRYSDYKRKSNYFLNSLSNLKYDATEEEEKKM